MELKILSSDHDSKSGIWSKLTQEEKSEVLEASLESEDPDNLIPHSEIFKSLK